MGINSRRLGPRLLRRFRYYRRRGPQDGAALDHGGAGRALPHAYHPAPEEGHRQRGSGRYQQEGRGDEPIRDFRQTVEEKGRIGQMLFGGFRRCLYPEQKFQSDPERKLALILDRETLKWLRPVRGQFELLYRTGADTKEYQPDFVAETDGLIYMMESKARDEMESIEVQVKTEAAVKWCALATTHAQNNGGKPWRYLLIPHDAITDNMTIEGLAAQFTVL